MDSLMIKKSGLWLGFLLILAVGFLLGFFTYSLIFPPAPPPPSSVLAERENTNLGDMLTKFMVLKQTIITKLKDEGKYRCCLKKVCSRCLTYHYHDKTSRCPCADDVLAGRAPCGECIGEILEGEGEPFYAKYFAQAIADEVGEKHLETLKQIISEKYKISIEEQKGTRGKSLGGTESKTNQNLEHKHSESSHRY